MRNPGYLFWAGVALTAVVGGSVWQLATEPDPPARGPVAEVAPLPNAVPAVPAAQLDEQDKSAGATHVDGLRLLVPVRVNPCSTEEARLVGEGDSEIEVQVVAVAAQERDDDGGCGFLGGHVTRYAVIPLRAPLGAREVVVERVNGLG
ncbi:hypothetical protein V5P93_002079 [Actinokineospora auranticolor]|uniref:Uncharacterized protein n=1 Tax=Actinokineospora auranticolor TaxID=155976 RepID=A0A2S6GDF8_9PSEU|nr:hypothetical protein [Actinokineospora auranticolor]PPK63277.1 hypothetical protein CLV40_13069 [Actinokineospora auranticolor]